MFDHTKALDQSESFTIQCGQCVGCRLDRSKEWAVRVMHETLSYEDNQFITLTFDDDHLLNRKNPESIDVSDFQKFMKRLRKQIIPKNPYDKKEQTTLYNKFHKKHQIRYYSCGEYGDKSNRPHRS